MHNCRKQHNEPIRASIKELTEILDPGAKCRNTVLTRLNAAAFIKFLAFPMRRIFKGGVYSRVAFISNHISSITDNNYGKSFAKIT